MWRLLAVSMACTSRVRLMSCRQARRERSWSGVASDSLLSPCRATRKAKSCAPVRMARTSSSLDLCSKRMVNGPIVLRICVASVLLPSCRFSLSAESQKRTPRHALKPGLQGSRASAYSKTFRAAFSAALWNGTVSALFLLFLFLLRLRSADLLLCHVAIHLNVFAQQVLVKPPDDGLQPLDTVPRLATAREFV